MCGEVVGKTAERVLLRCAGIGDIAGAGHDGLAFEVVVLSV
jgi:hypothetical protein